MKHEGCWIFLSHSSRDIEKVRIIRNQFEKRGQNPLAFHLRCLNTDTDEGRKELDNLIKREIDSREWFVFCESPAAKKSEYVQMEKKYIFDTGKKNIWSIDMSLPIEEIIHIVDEICIRTKVFISYTKRNRGFAETLTMALEKKDFEVWSDHDLMPGEAFDKQIYDAIQETKECGFFVLLITEDYLNSAYIQEELKQILEKDATIIPIVCGNAEVPQCLKNHKVYSIPEIPDEKNVQLIVALIEAELRRVIKGPMHQADSYTMLSRINEQLNSQNHYHPEEAEWIANKGAMDDYLEIYRFPCCGKVVVVGDGPISRFRADGCCRANH